MKLFGRIPSWSKNIRRQVCSEHGLPWSFAKNAEIYRFILSDVHGCLLYANRYVYVFGVSEVDDSRMFSIGLKPLGDHELIDHANEFALIVSASEQTAH